MEEFSQEYMLSIVLRGGSMSIYLFTLCTTVISIMVFIWFKVMKKYGGYN